MNIENLKAAANRLNVEIIEDYVTNSIQGHYPMKADYLTIHNAATSSSGKAVHEYNKYCLRHFKDAASKCWTFSVDKGVVYVAIPLNLNGWHAGDGASGPGNRRSHGTELGYDMVYNTKDYEIVEDTAARLAAAWRYVDGGKVDFLRMHQHWSGKFCPHRILERPNGWNNFKAKAEGYYQQLKKQDQTKPKPEPVKPLPKPEPDKPQKPIKLEKIYRVRVQVAAHKSKTKAIEQQQHLAKAGLIADVIEVVKEG